MTCCMLSTIDNPFNPFEDYSSWLMFDKEKNILASNHNIIMIRIDCKESNLNYIKNNMTIRVTTES